MTASKLNLILLPLLVSILLSTVGKLKIGRSVDNIFYTILYPISSPISTAKHYTDSKIIFLKNIPKIYQENQSLKLANSSLLSENQTLKDLLKDKNLLDTANTTVKNTIPLRIIKQGSQISTTTSLDISQIAIGQPVVSGTNLIGIVTKINAPIIIVTPLTDENFPSVRIKTSLGQTGDYQFQARTPQIINIPSENPVSLNDTVFTEASEKIPANLYLGKITKILTSSQSPLQKAEIKLDLDVSELKELNVITKP